MIYSMLTAAQQAQAQHLFADDLFGTDPHGYEYEVTGETVTGRKALTSEQQNNIHARKPRAMRMTIHVKEVPATDTHDPLYAVQLLVRGVFQRLTQTQEIRNVHIERPTK